MLAPVHHYTMGTPAKGALWIFVPLAPGVLLWRQQALVEGRGMVTPCCFLQASSLSILAIQKETLILGVQNN